MRIALDGMGGDRGPSTNVAGAIEALEADPALEVLLVGDEDVLRGEAGKHRFDARRLSVLHAPEVITMHDSPSVAVRQKRKSSLHVSNRLVKEGRASGVFTAGNTGAAMAVSLLTLGRLPGIIRPALLVDFPSITPHGRASLIDVGANVDCKPRMLVQFAVMADCYVREMHGVDAPRIGLLSLGEEDIKGNDLIRETRNLLKDMAVNYVGNLEGQDLVNGRTDVLVCDGFVGNVLLKFGSGMARMFVDLMKKEVLARGILARLTAGLFLSMLRGFYRRMDYSEVGAAPLLGVNGTSTIGHGKSSAKAIKNALLLTAKFCSLRVNAKIEGALRDNRVAE
mgnify:CR=1 FL=1